MAKDLKNGLQVGVWQRHLWAKGVCSRKKLVTQGCCSTPCQGAVAVNGPLRLCRTVALSMPTKLTRAQPPIQLRPREQALWMNHQGSKGKNGP